MAFHRLIPLALAATVLPACVDAPITPDQLEANGRLRAVVQEQAPVVHEQAAFSAQDRAVPQQAANAQLSAVLAAEAEGPLNDASRFPADIGRVNLHLRADGIEGPRDVMFRWTHRGDTASVRGMLEPGDTLALATSFPIDPERTGPWTVEILGAPSSVGQQAPVLFERSFEVFLPSH